MFSLPRAQVQTLVKELRYCKPSGMVKKKGKEKKKKEQTSMWVNHAFFTFQFIYPKLNIS